VAKRTALSESAGTTLGLARKLSVRLVDGCTRTVRLPPRYRIRRSEAGWYTWDSFGWRSPMVPTGSTGRQDEKNATAVVDHAWAHFTMSENLDAAFPDDRPCATGGEIVCNESPPPSLPSRAGDSEG